MSGHGTVINTDDGQGNCQAYISSNGGNSGIECNCIQTVANQSGKSFSTGQIACIDLVDGAVTATSQGSRGRGTVNAGGNKLTVSSAGNTDFTQGATVTIDTSGSYGNNSGFNNATVYFGNVNGLAAYLSTQS